MRLLICTILVVRESERLGFDVAIPSRGRDKEVRSRYLVNFLAVCVAIKNVEIWM